MTLLWPELADLIGFVAHAATVCSASYLAYWAWRSWRVSHMQIALGATWTATVIMLLSVVALFEMAHPTGTVMRPYIVEFRAWMRVALAATSMFLAATVWHAGRKK